MTADIDVFLGHLHKAQRQALERIRQIVLAAVPEADEVISYGMPGFKYRGKYLCGNNAFKDHLSFFPTAEPVELLKDRLQAYKLSKGTIQFSFDNPLPEDLVIDLVQIRLRAIEG